MRRGKRRIRRADDTYRYRIDLSHQYRLIKVFVEGYDDVAFWRGIFDDYETSDLKFEISVPTRPDLAKGKKVLLKMIPESSSDMIMCVDSDFDYLFGGTTEQSRTVNDTKYLFHTYTYATENYLCWAPTLHNVCVKATKNDAIIFDFVRFLKGYSKIIYPLFLWYAYSAQQQTEHAFSLSDFKNSVRLNYLELENNGVETLEWLARVVHRRVEELESKYSAWVLGVESFGRSIEVLGFKPSETYLYMQGHTLMNNVVMVMLNTVCDKLKDMATQRILSSQKKGVALRNELSNYNNSLRNVKEVLLDNEAYKDCPLYMKLKADIEEYIDNIKQ
ncbi:MAG: DUF4435 domain-containing protein [Rikenellaceae bacterium]